MSIKHIEGNLLDFNHGITIIAHCANTLGGVFGAGIAKQIAEEYPAALERDIEAHKRGEVALGGYSGAVLSNGKFVINLYGQERIGGNRRNLDYEAIYSALEALKEKLVVAKKEGRIHKLGLPKNMGCGLAGGNFRIVETMIEEIFKDSGIDVVIVEYKKEKA